MPWIRGYHIGPWAYCDRCGEPYRLAQMTMQNGQMLCNRLCWDDPLIWQRPGIIKEVLSTTNEEMMSEIARKRQEGNQVDDLYLFP